MTRWRRPARRWLRCWGAALLALLAVGVVPGNRDVASAAVIAYPDIRVKVPVSEISIGTAGATRYLEFSHVTWNAGAGPLEMRPQYDSATGLAQMVQALYASNGHGGWTFATTVPIVKQPRFVPPSDYRFPMSQFGLYRMTTSGGVGALVGPSPKVDFCMTPDDYVGGVPNTPSQSAYSPSNCASPDGTLGLDVGWGDKYDSTDAGENIDISSVPDGVYWLHAIADPYHYLRDSNVADNVTDTKLRITGTSVSVLEQTTPVERPPTVTLTAPRSGSKVSGRITLSATAGGPAPVASVQFLFDGRALGAADTTAPYSITWTVGATLPGTHLLAAQARDDHGLYRTSVPVAVTVPRRIGTMTIVTDLQSTATGVVHSNRFAAQSGELLVALVGSDGVGQTTTVSGGGLSWTRVRRNNHQGGDTEIWVAKPARSIASMSVTSTPARAGYDESLTVLGLTGALRVGASSLASGASGAPAIDLTTTVRGAAAFAVGNDFDHAIARTLGSGQLMLSQVVDSRTGDTYWAQTRTAASAAAGQHLTLNDTAPTTDQWNLAAVEIVPSPVSPHASPAVEVINPEAGQMLTGVVPVAALPRDDVAVAAVRLTLDGKSLGPVLTPPYGYQWDTRRVPNGRHRLGATVVNSAGTAARAAPVIVDVRNPAPPMVCFIMDAVVATNGSGALSTPPLHTGVPHEVLLAFVAGTRPRGAAPTFSVRGAGVTWHLVARSNASGGDAEIWQATATAVVAGSRVVAVPTIPRVHGTLTVIALQETDGVGASAVARAARGAPEVSLRTTNPHSLLFGVGVGSASAPAPGGNQQLEHAWFDSAGRHAFWVQSTNMQTGHTGTRVVLRNRATSHDRWNFAAVEVRGEPE